MPYIIARRQSLRDRVVNLGLLAFAVTALSGAICHSDLVEAAVGAAGQYQLTHVNGTAIGGGYTVPDTDPVVVFTGGTINLGGQNSGNYSVQIQGTQGGTAQTVVADVGSFTYSGNTVTFTSTVIPAPYPNVYTGNLAGNTLTITLDLSPVEIDQTVTLGLERNL